MSTGSKLVMKLLNAEFTSRVKSNLIAWQWINTVLYFLQLVSMYACTKVHKFCV